MKIIQGTNDFYAVTPSGKIYTLIKRGRGNLKREKPVQKKTFINNSGYVQVLLSINGKQKAPLVHRLVAMAFIPNPYGLPEVNHKDENKLNNSADNLEWCTHKYNQNYGTGSLRSSRKGLVTKMINLMMQPEIINAIISSKQKDTEPEEYTGRYKIALFDEKGAPYKTFANSSAAAAFLGVRPIKVRHAVKKNKMIKGFYLRRED